MKFRMALCMLTITLFAIHAAASGEEKAASTNAQRFEALKKLAGDWVAIGEDGKPTNNVVSSIRITSAGSVVQETLFPGSDHEMVTMYHLDGADLVLTHYCALGNQPRLKAEPGNDVNKIAFKFAGGTNMKSNDDQHMDHATLTIGTDRYKAEWTACKDGKSCHQANFDLVRRPK
jgi:hypothetical protein